MEKGDLSNEVVPRLVVVFEGLIGYLPDEEKRGFGLAVRVRRWKKALDHFRLNEKMARQIVDATWRRNYAIDVVTFLGEEYDEFLPDLLERWGLPIANCWYEDPLVLARRLAYAPFIAGVFHAHPELNLTFGSKGILVNPNDPHLFGGF